MVTDPDIDSFRAFLLKFSKITLSNIDFTFPTFDEFKTSEIEVSRLLNVALSRCQSSKLDHFDGEFVLLANIDYFKSVDISSMSEDDESIDE